jgi:hypothetical protein
MVIQAKSLESESRLYGINRKESRQQRRQQNKIMEVCFVSLPKLRLLGCCSSSLDIMDRYVGKRETTNHKGLVCPITHDYSMECLTTVRVSI